MSASKLDVANFVVLTLTLGVLIWYTIETHRIAEQTVSSNITPVILRGGVLDFDNLMPYQNSENPNFGWIELNNLKNIATEIRGTIVINHKKYPLFFANEVTQKKIETGGQTKFETSVAEKWIWLPPQGHVFATYSKQKFEQTNEDNNLYITYNDIEGNSYYTLEDKNYSQTSKPLK